MLRRGTVVDRFEHESEAETVRLTLEFVGLARHGLEGIEWSS
jgi:hypothetical protein